MLLALFDFDGTITTKDSMLDFVKYAVSKKSTIGEC
jgi:phosphoserine phosphatase